MTEVLWWINTTWACGGVVVESSGFIIETCPIFNKFRCGNIVEILTQLRGKGQLISSERIELGDFR